MLFFDSRGNILLVATQQHNRCQNVSFDFENKEKLMMKIDSFIVSGQINTRLCQLVRSPCVHYAVTMFLRSNYRTTKRRSRLSGKLKLMILPVNCTFEEYHFLEGCLIFQTNHTVDLD